MEHHENVQASRRGFLKKSAALLGTFPLAAHAIASPSHGSKANSVVPQGVKLNWLTKPLSCYRNATCGIVWPEGKVNKKYSFEATDEVGNPVPMQNWPLAYWPDGSLKWTAHTVVSGDGNAIYVNPIKKARASSGIMITEVGQQLVIDTGVIRCTLGKSGAILVHSIKRSDNDIVKNGRLVLLTQDKPDGEETDIITKSSYVGIIDQCEIEQRGPLRAVIKVTGVHRSSDDQPGIIPFAVRLYFHFQSDAIRVMHTMTYDADENNQFIKGIGVAFDIPLQDNLFNRHIRFSNSEHEGLFAEAVQGLTGLRRDPGEHARMRQLAGQAILEESELGREVASRLQYIPAFGDYTLFQGSDQSFTIRKRTSPGHSWIHSATGHRASGLMYTGTPKGGVVLGIRNFWQSYPAQLDIRNAASDNASATAWFWAPDAPAMDMRFYHDGMGQDTFPKQREGLEITYEDYEKGFGSPKGVARTSELMLWVVDKTPENKTLIEMTSVLQDPPLLLCDQSYLASQKVFGGNWSLVDRTVPEKVRIEDQLDRYFEYYKKQIDAHHWYGFWNYGDFMHSYDSDRHTWRYDVGGFAWDNSELSTDLWLWYYFLHTGRTDVFRIAEAMTRHTGEVDVHHLGPFAPLGSRHNVLHWGCSAKQLRISTAANRRIYYYLTGDERVGDLLNEQVDAVARLKDIVPGRKLHGGGIPSGAPDGNVVSVSFGTDWGAIAAAWFTRWERTEDPRIREQLLNSMQTIGAQPQGFFSGSAWMDLTNGKFKLVEDNSAEASHLSAVFGLTEICEELIMVVDVPGFTKAWVQYCKLYNASPQEQQQGLGKSLGKLGLKQGHSRLTAFAASHLKDEALAKRAWSEFYGDGGLKSDKSNIRKITGPEVLAPLEEDTSVSTNAVAQWGLAAIQCLAFVSDHIQER
jgi:hypothetical protein